MSAIDYQPELIKLLIAIGINVVLHIRSTFTEPSDWLKRCASCRYDLAGLAEDSACPECGGSERLPAHRERVVSFDYWGAALTGVLMIATVVTVNLARPVIWHSFYRAAGYDRVVFSLTHGACRLDGDSINVHWAYVELCFLPLLSRFRREVSVPVYVSVFAGVLGMFLLVTYAEMQAAWATGYVRW
jgi:hypothetical protein